MKYLVVLFFTMTSNLILSQTIEYDTIPSSNLLSTSFDTTIVSYPTVDGVSAQKLPTDIKSKIDTNNFINDDIVVLQLLISKTGQLKKIIIKKSSSQDCIIEAIRVIRNYKAWTPATFETTIGEQKKTRIQFKGEIYLTIPVVFKK